MAALQERVRARIRRLIEDAGYTQAQVGDRLQIDRTSVSRLLAEHGHALTLDFIEGISFLLQRSPQELVGDPTSPVVIASPLELQLVNRLREMTELQRQALLTVVDWRAPLAPGRRRRDLFPAPADAELLGLFHRLDDDPSTQAAILGLLRAAKTRA